jgi:hypothetical protein
VIALDPGTITLIQGVGFLDLGTRFVSVGVCFRAVGGWLVGGLPYEVGAAGSIASMLNNDDPW